MQHRSRSGRLAPANSAKRESWHEPFDAAPGYARHGVLRRHELRRARWTGQRAARRLHRRARGRGGRRSSARGVRRIRRAHRERANRSGPRPHRGPAVAAREAGPQGAPEAEQGRQDRQAGRRGAGSRGLLGLALVGRAGRNPGRAPRARTRQPATREARHARSDAPGPGDPRAEADAGCPWHTRRHAPGRPLQLAAARARVDQRRGQPPPAQVVCRPVAGQRHGGQAAPERHRAVVHRRREPRRLPVHLRRRAPVAQEPPRQRRRRPDDDPRRRRPEPELPRALALRRGGLVLASVERDLPRSRRRLGARDAGGDGPLRTGAVPVPRQLPLGGPVAPLPGGLADRDTVGRRSDLLRAVGQPRPPGDRRLPARPLLGRALRDERRDDGLGLFRARLARVDTGAQRRVRWLRVRLPRRRRPRAGGVRAESPVRTLGCTLRRGSGRPEVGPRHDDEAVLPPERRHLQGGPAGRELHVRDVVRRPATGAGAREAEPRSGDAEVPRERWGGAQRAHRRMGGRRSLRRPRLLLPRRARRGHGHGSGRQRGGLVRGRRCQERVVHLHGRGRVGETRSRRVGRGLQRSVTGSGSGAPLSPVLPRRARGERDRGRRLRRRRARTQGTRPPRRAQPLRLGRSGTRATMS